MPSSTETWTIMVLGILSSLFLLAIVYTIAKYGPIVSRNFERPPLFQPLKLGREPGGEDVRFAAADGIELGGTYFRTPRPSRVGVVVFCHEYLGDRWSFDPYASSLLEAGYDVFTFDFRNHGESAVDPAYSPLQWVSDRESLDLRAALGYLLARYDADPAGVALFGVSRGGSAALCVAADEPRVWAVLTDGAFPTRGTLRVYMARWAEVYVRWRWLANNIPVWVLDLVWANSRRISEANHRCQYLDVERAVRKLAPRPWFMIHGAKDNYIGPEIARALFELAGEPKESWFVPEARHNRCREAEPEVYAARLVEFLGRFSARPTAAAEARAAAVAADPPRIGPAASLV